MLFISGYIHDWHIAFIHHTSSVSTQVDIKHSHGLSWFSITHHLHVFRLSEESCAPGDIQTLEEYGKFTQKGPGPTQGSNPWPSWCEPTMLQTKCCNYYSGYARLAFICNE